MRILLLSPEYLPTTGGGIITYYRNLLPAFVRAGHSVRVIQGSGVFTAVEASRTVIEGVQVEVLEHRRFLAHKARFAHFDSMPSLRNHLAAAWAMWEQAGQGRDCDVVEACDWGLLFVPPVVTAALPTTVQMHGSVGQIEANDPIRGEETQGVLVQLLELAALKRATQLQSYSNANAAFWRSQLDAPVRRILPAWRPVTTPLTQPTIKPHGLVLGRVQHWKGPHVLCQAMALVGPQALTIDWIGRDTADGQRGKSLSSSLAAQYPSVWGTRIRHGAPVPPEEAWARQCSARFNIVPSTWDVFNFTCAEAMASGRPVICSDGAGASELIEDSVNGFVYSSTDAAGLARAIERVMTLSDAQSCEIGRAAQVTIAAALDPDRIAAERLAAYADAIASFVPRPAASGDWLLQACSGRAAGGDDLAFLDHLPLRRILGYGHRRLARKILRGARG